MAEDISQQKRGLRATIRAGRNARVRAESEGTVLQRYLSGLVTEFDAQTVSCFLPSAGEPNVRPFISWARESGHRVLLPISGADGRLEWSLGEDGEASDPVLKVPTPLGEQLAPGAIKDASLLIIPAAAIARDGMRLGWGRGYFDRTLALVGKWVPVFAVVFEDEVLDAVPHESHDRPVDGVVTPTGVLRFSRKSTP